MIFLSVLLTIAPAFARPAYQGTTRIKQPDGTYVTIRLVGDEYRSFNTTSDGYTLTRNNQGYYVYAQLDADGRLAPTELVAHDADGRTAADAEYLQRVGKWLTPAMSDSHAQVRRRNQAARSQALAQRRAQLYDYSKFRGLIILAEFNDCPFRYDDYADIMEKMINQDNYTGESRTNISAAGIKCTGSLRDYFRDNSTDVFQPTFDVVGPVKINRSQYYPRPNGSEGADNYKQLMTDVINAADDQVNYKDYDIDGDGTMDMVYFIFSGIPSYIQGNDERLLWPHQSDLRWYTNLRKDGVTIGRYACSTELFGGDDYAFLEGIGTIAHEFSHVLGLPDFYDTDNVNPEACVNPGSWSVMAGGADYNYGRTPCNFSLFERYALGFATPQVISEPGEYSMEAIHVGNSGFRLNTPVKREYFLIENRQMVKWDAQLPGHGMLIFRVDSTNSQAWYNNIVNDNPNHPYYELVRARGVQSSGGLLFQDSGRDAFPGTGRVTRIDNDTEPASLLTWAKKRNDYGLRSISEKSGVISFVAYLANVLTAVELPDSITIDNGAMMQLTPVLTPENVAATMVWTSSDESVATVSADGLVAAVGEGTATITVTANETITATCVVIVTQMRKAADIAAFRAMDEGSAALLTLDSVQVLFVNGSDTYVRDSSGSIKVSVAELSVKAGNILDGTLFGQLDVTNMMPQLSAVNNSTFFSGVNVTAGTAAPVPRDIKHSDSLTYDMLCDLVSLRAATLILENKMVFAQVGNQKVRVFNTFKLKNISVPKAGTYDGKYFDLTGILTTEIINGELTYVISITESVVEVEKPADDDIAGDVNGDGTVNVANIAAIIDVMAGLAENPKADVNGDGTVNVADISNIISIMAE